MDSLTAKRRMDIDRPRICFEDGRFLKGAAAELEAVLRELPGTVRRSEKRKDEGLQEQA